MGTPSTHLTSSALGRLSKARYGLRSKSDGRVNDGMMTRGRATGHRKGDATRGWAPCAQRHWKGGWETARARLTELRRHTAAQHSGTATGSSPPTPPRRIPRLRLDRHPTPCALRMCCSSLPCISHAVHRSPTLRQPCPVHTDLLPQPYSAVYSEYLARLSTL